MDSEYSQEDTSTMTELATQTSELSIPTKKWEFKSIFQIFKRKDKVTKMAETRVGTFDRVCESSREVFVQKNEEYGDSIVATGVLGASVELVGTSARLKKLAIRATDEEILKNTEELVQIFKDLHNYANIALMMLSDENLRGR